MKDKRKGKRKEKLNLKSFDLRKRKTNMGYVQSDLELFKFDYALNFDLQAIPDFNIPIPSPPPPPPIKVANIEDIPMEVSAAIELLSRFPLESKFSRFIT